MKLRKTVLYIILGIIALILIYNLALPFLAYQTPRMGMMHRGMDNYNRYYNAGYVVFVIAILALVILTALLIPSQTSKKCRQCGLEIESEAWKICPSCGARIEGRKGDGK